MQRRSVAVMGAAEPGTETMPAAEERLTHMFEAHHAVVWRTLRRCGLDAEAAADVGQQAFLVAIERISDIWPGSERAFLIGTALRLARRSRQRAARVQLDDKIESRARQAHTAEQQASTLELLDWVLASLDPTLVEVFVLQAVEGFSSPEIAQALAIPLGTVASRLRRAREEFRSAARRLELLLKREEGAP
jgi:RNA polymerase sigma-70 factor (ECF subfamily)